jgi:hypothetical protein
MVPILIIAAAFVLLLLYLLFAPLAMVVDTRSHRYYLNYAGIFKASLLEDKEELLKVRFRVAFVNFYWYPLREGFKRNKVEKSNPPTERRRNKSMNGKTLIRLLKSFNVKRFSLSLDTGDCVRNASLYPIFALLNQYRGGFHINYLGENALLLHVENRPIRIIKSFINL